MSTTLTISLDEQLDAELREAAKRQDRPLSRVVVEAIRAGLKRTHRRNGAPSVPSATTDAGDRT